MILQEASEDDMSDPCMVMAGVEALKSTLKFKLGAVIVKRGRVLAVGHNNLRTHPLYGSKPPYHTLHSEGDALYALKKLGGDAKGAIMYVARAYGRNAKPCPHCQRLIEKSGIKKVIYTNKE